MKIRTSLLTIVLFSFIFSGCATTSTSQNNLSTPDNKYSYDGKSSQDQKHLKNNNFIDDITYSKYMSKRDIAINNELFSFYNEWKGTKYRMGGYTKKGIDCSGFVQKAILEKFDLKLPRDSRSQSLVGTTIKKSELQMGDLVFFHTGKTKHVGIYIDNGQFMHASTKIGVTISKIDDDYFRNRYWKATRVLK